MLEDLGPWGKTPGVDRFCLCCYTGLTFTPWFKLIAKSFLYQWWDRLMERSKTLELLEGTHPQAAAGDGGKSGKEVDVEVLRDLITKEEKEVIKRF